MVAVYKMQRELKAIEAVLSLNDGGHFVLKINWKSHFLKKVITSKCFSV